jgi:hypothetical protein
MAVNMRAKPVVWANSMWDAIKPVNAIRMERSNVIPDVNHPCIRPEQRPMISFVLNNQLMEMNAVLLLLAPEVR